MATGFTSWSRVLLGAIVAACAYSEPLDLAQLDAGLGSDANGPPFGAGGGAAGAWYGMGGTTGTTGGGIGAGGIAPPGAGGLATPPPGAGGRPATPSGDGGAPNAAGGRLAGAGGSTAECTAEQKRCGGACVLPSPAVGCGPDGCTPCEATAPANGYLTCTDGACGFDCFVGFTKTGGSCMGTGAGGGSSTGGGSCPTSAIGCPDCGVVFGPGCCAQSKCGCPLIPWTAGALGCL